jgi:hypothetical protein
VVLLASSWVAAAEAAGFLVIFSVVVAVVLVSMSLVAFHRFWDYQST